MFPATVNVSLLCIENQNKALPEAFFPYTVIIFNEEDYKISKTNNTANYKVTSLKTQSTYHLTSFIFSVFVMLILNLYFFAIIGMLLFPRYYPTTGITSSNAFQVIFSGSFTWVFFVQRFVYFYRKLHPKLQMELLQVTRKIKYSEAYHKL